MAHNAFGQLFRFTTFGESHGPAIGVVIDGCPAGLEISEAEVNQALAERAPGGSVYTSPRKESDHCSILSGLFEGKTTGAPLCILIINCDADPSKYEPLKNLLRPGHANFTYLQKYGIFDYRGGGRASARETAARVAAGAVARKLLALFGIEICAYLSAVGSIQALCDANLPTLRQRRRASTIFCPDPRADGEICSLIESLKAAGDSVGGVVEMRAEGLPAGLGDPIYHKIEALLAQAMLSLPAVKGFEVGSGFAGARMRGSEHNDRFLQQGDAVVTESNHAGGTLAGMTTGMPLIARIALKPASSIKQQQQTIDLEGKESLFSLPEGSRHDPCVAIRAVPVVEAMLALVLIDRLLVNRAARVESHV
jgi:chorismate synthase